MNRDFDLDGPAEVTGTVVKVVYSNPDTYFTVLSVAPDSGSVPVAVVGVMAGLREGERVCVTGHWERDKRGWQIKMERYRIALPVSRDGVERYLSSGLIPGIGKHTARLLVKRFGDQTLEVIRDSPERLRTVKGIGQKKIAELSRAFREHAGYAELLAYLQGIGVSISMARKIHQALGDDAVGRLRANPWSLAEVIDGVGFRRADDIANGLGLSGDHPERVAAGLLHALEEARRDGHVALPKAELITAAAALLAVTEERVSPILDVLLVGGRAVFDRGLTYLPPLHRAETRVCRNLFALATGLKSRIPDGLVSLHVAQAQSVLGVMLAPEQIAAVEIVIQAPVGVVTGGPGTGKTTTVRAIVTAFEALNKKVLLAAPTGRAAKRLSLSTSREAKTLHRLLEWVPQGGFQRGETKPLDCDAVILDEVSMVDLPLFDALLRAMRPGMHLVIVGDADQLPSVGPGSVLRDLIDSSVFPVTRLQQVFRQGKGSAITESAHRVLLGELPSPTPTGEKSDFYWIEKEKVDEIQELLPRLIKRRIPDAYGLDPVRDVQVLTPVHRGPLGADTINELLGDALNPSPDRHRESSGARTAPRYVPGDKVMQVRNNYEKEVWNGDVGFVHTVSERGDLHVAFEESGRVAAYTASDRDELVPAWAITIHKSQGSEYPAVVLVLHATHHVMLRRTLLYTALTRGRQLVVVVGPRRALAQAIGAAAEAPRHGALRQRLSDLRPRV